MCCSDVWSEKGLPFKRLPTLQELLTCCDEELFMRVVMEDHVARAEGPQAVPPKRRRDMEKRLARSLESMKRLDAGKGSRSRVLMPEEAFVLHARSGLVERRVSASQAHRDDAGVVLGAVQASEASVAGTRVLQAAVKPKLPETRPYALDTWERTLSCRVWMAGPWCRRERYQVLASAFWEMTFFGFEYDRAAAGRAREKARRAVGAKNRPPQDDGAFGIVVPPASTASADRTRRARAYGLLEPDRFADDYQESLVRRVAELNRLARIDFWMRLVDLVRGSGRSGPDAAVPPGAPGHGARAIV